MQGRGLPSAEHERLRAAKEQRAPWRRWGPYLSERQWGTVREDYSEGGNAWDDFTHDQARSRAYHWGEDGLAGISDDAQRLCFALALWNGNDSILKERLFGLTNSEGNHGEASLDAARPLHAPERADSGLRMELRRREPARARLVHHLHVSPREGAGRTRRLPEGGYYVARARTSRVFIVGRAFLQKNDPQPAVQRIEEHLKIYPYAAGGTGSSVALFLEGRGPFNRITPPGSPRFIEGTGVEMNTIVPNDRSFFELLDEAVQQESSDAIDPERAGQFAALGLIKGRPFRSDARLQKILEEAIATANAAARTLSFRPRDAEDFAYYGAASAWVNILFLGGFDFLRPPPLVTKDGVESLPSLGGYALHARTTMFYLAFGVTPAMCMRMTGVGSQYLGCMVDAHGAPFDGARTYTLKLPPNIPAAAFWSITLYDNQTRSMLQTPQRFPRAGSQSFPTPAARQSVDGSTTLTFCPQRPHDVEEGNWIQTTAGKGWFAVLRLYSPLAPFFDKSWRPGEIEPAPG